MRRRHPAVLWSLQEGSFSKEKEAKAGGEDVQLRERHVARPAAEGFSVHLRVGPVQPAVLTIWEPLLIPKLPFRLSQLQPLVLRESPPASEKERVEEAPPADVQALLALFLAQPVPIPWPPLPGEAPRAAPEVFPVSLAAQIAQSLARKVRLQKVALRRLEGAAVPGGARPVEGEIAVQDEVTEPNPLSFE